MNRLRGLRPPFFFPYPTKEQTMKTIDSGSFSLGLVWGILFTGLLGLFVYLLSLYSPGEGRYYYPWYETEAICVQTEKQNCRTEYKEVYVAYDRRYDYGK
ncbi:hypothetical protein SBP1_gp008 [Vibrio virus vB_VspP_SBP1]|uniref:Uncharacterized protein n=1 Tax=Vibrio virus vB_VspP_SBP1 TaxID=2500581 RepID=A0A3T0III2_9CAUD|nr:hypothetical protein KNU36_gp008 [Vibrio virus vB_VspP_SBP1]AZU99600.1 hypothetical protein SBP1_gp008 [Vibrio virus vB_VspP_SBP1]